MVQLNLTNRTGGAGPAETARSSLEINYDLLDRFFASCFGPSQPNKLVRLPQAPTNLTAVDWTSGVDLCTGLVD